jgi:formiminoglutamase
MHSDRLWPTAADWLGAEAASGRSCAVGVIGIPLHIASITPGRCDLAPAAIRSILRRASVYDVEHDRDLRALAIRDFGDLPVAALRPEAALVPIVENVGSVAAAAHQATVILGGDNSVTRPAFHALWRRTARAGLLTLDAHFDLRACDSGLTNGNPIRALLHDGLAGSCIVQIGIQPFANSREYADVARDAGIRFVAAGEASRRGIESTVRDALDQLSAVADEIYVDADLDVLERCSAPGTPGARAGGLTAAELRQALLLCGAHPRVRMIDFVEFDPAADIADITAHSAAMAFLSFLSGVAGRTHTGKTGESAMP